MKLDQWLKPNAFSLSLPDTWTIRELERSMELVPQRADAVLQISLYNKAAAGPATAAAAQALVAHFASQNALRAEGKSHSAEQGAQWLSVGSFRAPEGGTLPPYWRVCGVASTKRMAVASLSGADGQGASFAEGEDILRSLTLL